MVIGHSSGMCLTARIFLQTHVTFCEYLVFDEFRRNLYITLAKYLEHEVIADLLLSKFLIHSLLTQSHDTKVGGYCVIFQTCFRCTLFN